jgi:hypothetical protein
MQRATMCRIEWRSEFGETERFVGFIVGTALDVTFDEIRQFVSFMPSFMPHVRSGW